MLAIKMHLLNNTILLLMLFLLLSPHLNKSCLLFLEDILLASLLHSFLHSIVLLFLVMDSLLTTRVPIRHKLQLPTLTPSFLLYCPRLLRPFRSASVPIAHRPAISRTGPGLASAIPIALNARIALNICLVPFLVTTKCDSLPYDYKTHMSPRFSLCCTPCRCFLLHSSSLPGSAARIAAP